MKKQRIYDDGFYDPLMEVSSSMECTGLIPAAPVDEAQLESYGQLYDIPTTPDWSLEKQPPHGPRVH